MTFPPIASTVLSRLTAAVAMVLAALVTTPAAAGPYLVFDVANGEVLAENDAFHPWYPASLTKLMTAYVTFRAIDRKEISLSSPVVMTAHAAKEPPSKMGFKPGTAITVDTALKILIVKSANDVAVALGEAVGGDEAGFVARMNAEARRLGMNGTRFANPNGLPDAGQWTTARDYALLARAIIREYPQYRELFRITGLSLGGKVIKTHNHLLERFPGTDGMKTGFICASGFNVVASATRDGRQIVAVVLGERNAKVRAEKSASLLATAFETGSGLFSRRTRIDELRPKSAPPAAPVDLRPYVCGKNKNVGEDADAEVAAAGVAKVEAKSFLVPRFHLMDPVPITVGAAAAPVPGVLPPLPRPNPTRAAATAVDVAPTAFAPEPAAAADVLIPPPPEPPIEILGIRGSGG